MLCRLATRQVFYLSSPSVPDFLLLVPVSNPWFPVSSASHPCLDLPSLSSASHPCLGLPVLCFYSWTLTLLFWVAPMTPAHMHTDLMHSPTMWVSLNADYSSNYPFFNWSPEFMQRDTFHIRRAMIITTRYVSLFINILILKVIAINMTGVSSL